MTERLHRLEYVFHRLPIYFMTACTHERQRISNNADVHQQFVEFGIEGEARGAWLGAYILMPEHLHAFVVVDDERLKLSRWIKSLKNTVLKVLRGKGIRSPHWQKGFFDHMLRSGDSDSAQWEYGRENPVRGGLVNNWREWPFIGEILDLEFREDRL